MYSCGLMRANGSQSYKPSALLVNYTDIEVSYLFFTCYCGLRLTRMQSYPIVSSQSFSYTDELLTDDIV